MPGKKQHKKSRRKNGAVKSAMTALPTIPAWPSIFSSPKPSTSSASLLSTSSASSSLSPSSPSLLSLIPSTSSTAPLISQSDQSALAHEAYDINAGIESILEFCARPELLRRINQQIKTHTLTYSNKETLTTLCTFALLAFFYLEKDKIKSEEKNILSIRLCLVALDSRNEKTAFDDVVLTKSQKKSFLSNFPENMLYYINYLYFDMLSESKESSDNDKLFIDIERMHAVMQMHKLQDAKMLPITLEYIPIFSLLNKNPSMFIEKIKNIFYALSKKPKMAAGTYQYLSINFQQILIYYSHDFYGSFISIQDMASQRKYNYPIFSMLTELCNIIYLEHLNPTFIQGIMELLFNALANKLFSIQQKLSLLDTLDKIIHHVRESLVDIREEKFFADMAYRAMKYRDFLSDITHINNEILILNKNKSLNKEPILVTDENITPVILSAYSAINYALSALIISSTNKVDDDIIIDSMERLFDSLKMIIPFLDVTCINELMSKIHNILLALTLPPDIRFSDIFNHYFHLFLKINEMAVEPGNENNHSTWFTPLSEYIHKMDAASQESLYLSVVNLLINNLITSQFDDNLSQRLLQITQAFRASFVSKVPYAYDDSQNLSDIIEAISSRTSPTVTDVRLSILDTIHTIREYLGNQQATLTLPLFLNTIDSAGHHPALLANLYYIYQQQLQQHYPGNLFFQAGSLYRPLVDKLEYALYAETMKSAAISLRPHAPSLLQQALHGLINLIELSLLDLKMQNQEALAVLVRIRKMLSAMKPANLSQVLMSVFKPFEHELKQTIRAQQAVILAATTIEQPAKALEASASTGPYHAHISPTLPLIATAQLTSSSETMHTSPVNLGSKAAFLSQKKKPKRDKRNKKGPKLIHQPHPTTVVFFEEPQKQEIPLVIYVTDSTMVEVLADISATEAMPASTETLADISAAEIIATSTEVLADIPTAEIIATPTVEIMPALQHDASSSDQPAVSALTNTISSALFSSAIASIQLAPLSPEQEACRQQYQQSKQAFEQNNNLGTLLAVCLAGDALNAQMQTIWEKPAHRAHLNMLTRYWDSYLCRLSTITGIRDIDTQLVHLSRTSTALAHILQDNAMLFTPTVPSPIQAMTFHLRQAQLVATHEHSGLLAQRQALILEHQLNPADFEHAAYHIGQENHALWIEQIQAALTANQQQLAVLNDEGYIWRP